MGSDSFYHSIVNLVSDIIWEVDENCRYTYISGEITEYINFTSDELIGKTPFILMTEEEAVRIKQKFFAISSTRKSITDFELRILNNKNEFNYLLINAIPVIDCNDRLTGYRGISRDITDKKKIEAELMESEAHLSALMNNLPGMAYRGSFKEGFRMEFVSNGAYALSGYTPSEFIGKQISSRATIHPDDIKMTKAAVRKALNEKKQYDVIFRIFTADSKIKWIMDKGFGIYKEGKLTGIEGFTFDISETREAIEHSRINERRFRNLFESNPQGIAITNKNGYVVQVNKIWKKMFGYQNREIHNLHLNDLRFKQYIPSDSILFESLFRGDIKSYRIERPYLKTDSTLLWCDLTIALIEDPDEKEIYAIGLFVDISERKKIEAELKTLQEELENLVLERTEEINRLTLKVISSQEEERLKIARDLHDGVGQTMLAAKYSIDSFIKSEEKNKKLLEQGKQLIDIASQELREIYTGIYPAMLNELSLTETISWFIRYFLEAAGLKVVYYSSLEVEIQHELKVNIYRMLQEIFNNIVKHSQADSVSVSLLQNEQFIIIEVSDNGIGFDIEKTRKTNTGAGLINIRQRVEFLKGQSKMESIKGKTWIKIEIPLEQI